MKTLRVSTKGQIVIPKKLRKHLNIKPGDQLVFRLENNKLLLTKEKESPFDRYYGFLNKTGSSDDLVREMRGKR